MDEKGFRAFVAAGKRVKADLDEAEIRSNLEIVSEFERFLSIIIAIVNVRESGDPRVFPGVLPQ